LITHSFPAGEHTLLSRSGIMYMAALIAAMYMVPKRYQDPGPGNQAGKKEEIT